MKVWLVNPRIDGMIATELPEFVAGEVGRFPPLGLLCLAAALRQNNRHDVRVIDMPAKDMSYEAFAGELRREQPSFVGITAITHNLVDVLRAAECVKQNQPQAHVCLGGPHVDAFPAEAIGLLPVDFTVWGEGDEALPRLVEAIEAGRSPGGLPGVSWKENGHARLARSPAPAIEDLDALPMPARDLLDGRDYFYVLGRRATFTTLISSRGCPFRCVFCSTPRGRFRARSPAGVVDEMQACLKAGVEEIHFVDDTFNAAAGRLAAVSREIIERGLRVRWSVRARINNITEEDVRLARKAGCVRMHFGVETGTDEGLRVLRKDLTTARIEEAFKILRRCRMTSAAYFMIGCPNEKTRADVLRTIDFARRLDPDFAMFNILAIYPKTELFNMAVARGMISPDYWNEFARRPYSEFRLRFWEESFSSADLAGLLRIAYRRFYFRPRVIWRNLLALGSMEDLKHKASAALAMLLGPKKQK